MKLKKISKFLAGSALVLFLLGSKNISAQEVKPINIEEIIYGEDLKVHYPKIDLFFNYEQETPVIPPTSLKSSNYFDGNNLVRDGNIPEINLEETSQLENLIKDIANKKVKSYSEFIELSKNLSESQKIVLFASLSQLLYAGSYNDNSQLNEIQSQEVFFNSLQNFLNNYNQNFLGQCSQIATYIEKSANDNKIKTSTVTGMVKEGRIAQGHVFDILKLKNGTGIVDGERILISKTKNIEKTLESYQKEVGALAFQHLLFENNNFKYEIISPGGRNFLEFIGYDISSKPIKNSLIDNIDSNSEIIFALNQKKELTSFELNYFGFIFKGGELRGDSSPLEKLSLAQVGFKRKFSFSTLEITPVVNMIIKDGEISGGVIDLVINSASEKGFNVSSRISGSVLLNPTSLLFYHYPLGAGASYNVKTEFGAIEPYSVVQVKYMMRDLGMQHFGLIFDEFEAGLKLNNFPTRNLNVSINPYYTKRLWEQEVGADVKVNIENFELNARGYLTSSNYAFCPDRSSFDFGVDTSINKYFNLNAKYKIEQTNYDGERENISSLSLTGKINFN